MQTNMKTHMKHLLDLPKIGTLQLSFPEDHKPGEEVLSLLNDQCLYTIMIETDADKLFNLEGITYLTKVRDIRSNRVKVTKVKINEDADNTFDLKLVYNNKSFWLKVHSCLRTGLC